MDADKLAKLRAIADEAAREWSSALTSTDDGAFEYATGPWHDQRDGDTDGANWDAHFIATFNPSVVKAMLDVVEAGQAALADWYIDDSSKDLRRALAALADKLK